MSQTLYGSVPYPFNRDGNFVFDIALNASLVLQRNTTRMGVSRMHYHTFASGVLTTVGFYKWTMFENYSPYYVCDSGDFYFDGTNLYQGSELMINIINARNDIASSETAIKAHAAVLQQLTDANTDVMGNAITSQIAAQNDLSTSEIETALLDDGDGSAFRSALATTIENYLLNDTDGQAVLAGISGAVTTALTSYNAAKKTDISAATAAITLHDDTNTAQVKSHVDVTVANALSILSQTKPAIS